MLGSDEPGSISEKVASYEKFLNEKLRRDLHEATEERNSIVKEIQEYETLKLTVERLQCSGETKNLETRVDLGCNVFVNAEIPDASMIFVKVGFGFFVEFTLSEASKFCDKKLVLLRSKDSESAEQILKIQQNVEIIEQGLAQLKLLSLRSDEKTM